MLNNKVYFDMGQHKNRLIQISLVIFFMIISFGLSDVNKSLIKENKKLNKFISKETSLNDHLLNKKLSEKVIMYTLKIKPDTSLEKIRLEYMNVLLEMIKQKDLKVDSYNSEEIKENQLIKFRYTIKTIGDYIKILDFYEEIIGKYKFFLIHNFRVDKRADNIVKAEISLDLICVKE